MEEVLTKSNGQETKVDYAIVYAEVDRLYRFLYEEILQQDEALTGEIVGNLECLRGHANDKMIEASHQQSEKTQMISTVLAQLLSFIEQSAISYEILDNDLSSEIGKD